MQKFVQPTKEQVRDWFRQRRLAAGPPPAIAQMRRELGWRPIAATAAIASITPELAAGAGHGSQPDQVCNLSIAYEKPAFQGG